MYYLKDQNNNLLRIAKNEKAFIESVFHPGGTCAGYIKKITKHKIDFVVHNRDYCLNKYGVILSVTKKDSKKWYQCQIQFDYKSALDFKDSLTISKDYFSQKDVVYFYK